MILFGVIMSQMKKDCGYAAAELVKDGQILGLGTGSTTLYFIEKVGMRVRDEGIEVMGIPTSFQSNFSFPNKQSIPYLISFKPCSKKPKSLSI